MVAYKRSKRHSRSTGITWACVWTPPTVCMSIVTACSPSVETRHQQSWKEGKKKSWKVLWVGLIHRPRNNLVSSLFCGLIYPGPRCLKLAGYRGGWKKKSHLSLLPLWDRLPGLIEFLVKVWVIPTHFQIPINFSDDTSGSLHRMHIHICLTYR